jgi:hypothetical protein
MSEDPVTSAARMLRGAWVTMVLRAGCLLGVFDSLDEPRTALELAEKAECDPTVMTRFLRVLVDLDLAEVHGDSYIASAVGATLSSTHAGHLRDVVLNRTELPIVASWHQLDTALRTGAGVYEQVNGMSHWQHLAAHPEDERIFNAAMSRRGSAQAAMLLDAVDLEGATTLVDVGGGRGAMVAVLLQGRPSLTGVVADRPAVAEEATRFLAESGLGARGHGVGCDFFASVPSGGDVYTIAHVLHDWTDAECVRILRTVRSAMPDDGRLLVVERVLGAPGRTPDQERDLHLLDLHMLVLFGARERTQAEYDVLLTAAGFSPSRLGGTGDWNVLEARPAR